MKRILIGGIVGGLVVFIWGALSHTVLPIGEMGISQIPNEEAVLDTMKGSLQEHGLYFFPWMDHSGDATEAEQQAWEERYRAGPTGILVYSPRGESPMSPKQLLTELGTNVAAALIAAILLSLTVAGFFSRVVLVALLGLFGWLSISLSYWNWYRFPWNFTIAEGIDQVIGWFLAGLVLAAIVKGSRG